MVEIGEEFTFAFVGSRIKPSACVSTLSAWFFISSNTATSPSRSFQSPSQ